MFDAIIICQGDATKDITIKYHHCYETVIWFHEDNDTKHNIIFIELFPPYTLVFNEFFTPNVKKNFNKEKDFKLAQHWHNHMLKYAWAGILKHLYL